jgi:hypothetical protein
MIDKFYKTSFEVKRQEWVTETINSKQIKKSSEVTVATFSGHIQQADPEFAQFLGLSTTKTFIVWCPVATDVDDGDTLVTSDSKYGVRGKKLNQNGKNKHLELVVEWFGKAVVSNS